MHPLDLHARVKYQAQMFENARRFEFTVEIPDDAFTGNREYAKVVGVKEVDSDFSEHANVADERVKKEFEKSIERRRK